MPKILDEIKRLKKNLKDDSQSKDEILKQFKRIYDAHKDKSYYDMFNVTHPLSDEDRQNVKKCYRQAALIVHPDKVSDYYKAVSNELFIMIEQGFEVLSDEQKERNHFLAQATPTVRHTFNPAHPRPSQTTVKIHRTHTSNKKSFFQSSKRVLEGNLKAGKHIDEMDRNISITGDVYGEIQTITGDIEVNGNVYGRITSMTGKLTIHGAVMPDAVVDTVSNDIHVDGKLLGHVNSTFSRVYHNGHEYVAPNTETSHFNINDFFKW